jgi:predicted metalloprotease
MPRTLDLTQMAGEKDVVVFVSDRAPDQNYAADFQSNLDGYIGCGGWQARIAAGQPNGFLLKRTPEAESRRPPQVAKAPSPPVAATPADEIRRFIARVLASTEVVWKDIFSRGNETYRPPVLVLYRDEIQNACGGRAVSSMGPIYCSADRKIYFDSSFLDNFLVRVAGCNGDACQFAGAYVIARPVGSHVQNLLGILARAQDTQQPDRLKVRIELQADCLTGVWAKHQNDLDRSQSKPPFVEQSEVETALGTITTMEDAVLQQQAQVPSPRPTSEQRRRWILTGFTQGTIASCNTFAAAAP